jgi:hypothetical protein
MKLEFFKQKDNLFNALENLFKGLNIPVNIIDEKSIAPVEILTKTYKDNNEAFQIMEDVIAFGMVDDAAFSGNAAESLDNVKKNKKDYDGILLFGVTLKKRSNGLLPTRTQLAEITRAFNREYHYTPVVVVFRYADYISIANAERITYKQEWREGEKAGKVSLLRDIEVKTPHTGHLKILQELKITRSGRNGVNNFKELYKYWQEVFSVSILNKQFYKELSDWYFWAMREVYFPDAPFQANFGADGLLDPEVREHNAKNLIRLLTRILFVWFIKEKKLIPEELFDENYIKTELLKNFEPQKNTSHNYKTQGSMYYRAILQNLFFATLNQDMGKREFRKDGQNRNVTNLMRYKRYFKNPDAFIELVEDVVPFMNGGLFECLDKPMEGVKGKRGGEVIKYIDGFSDRDENPLLVPDYVFFGTEDHINLSDEYGQGKSKNKDVSVKGLIDILQSYKFTIAENTPIEQDIALDPELLGRVFENLLASYNPETKTTARKQTGSFYTPREIVNYMVDESLIAHLKNKLNNPFKDDKELDNKLHQLLSYDDIQPFDDEELKEAILKAIDECKILDPACGSGAFPMGALQKMVHIIYKLDPQNKRWKERQIEKAYAIEDADIRNNLIDDVEEAFENNELDFGRKLYLIENCIYGVDIQPIAVQISKLRFFISLIVDQKVNKQKTNHGVRPLPNLETKFVAANTLIGLEESQAQGNLFDSEDVKKLEEKLKDVRHRLFSAKTPKTKRKLREEDKELREQIAQKLEESGWGNKTARQLADWDPYDQNASSPFFNKEWMFDIANGFDIVIGNPPYIKEYTDKSAFDGLREMQCYQGKMDIWYLFGSKSIDLLKDKGNTCFIATNNWVTNEGASKFRNKVLRETTITQFLDFRDFMIFESASIQTMVYLLEKIKKEKYVVDFRRVAREKCSREIAYELLIKTGKHEYYNLEIEPLDYIDKRISFIKEGTDIICEKILNRRNFMLDQKKEVAQGIVAPQDYMNRKGASKLNNKIAVGTGIFNISDHEKKGLNLMPIEENLVKPFYTTEQLSRYYGNQDNNSWVIYTDSSFKNTKAIKPYPNLKKHLDQFQNVITSDNKPYGLHRARNENFFKGEKIISLRKCPQRPVFTYTDFDCYVSQTFFVVKTNRINQKYLTGLFNSKLTAFWLKNKGKMQGVAYQVDKGPILEIPIYEPSGNFQVLTATLVDFIIYDKNQTQRSKIIDSIIDAIVFNLYFPGHMKERGIDVLQFVEQDINEVMQGKEFEKLSDVQKESVVNQLHNRWTDPENEVVKRMAMFKEKSPDILKPILES